MKTKKIVSLSMGAINATCALLHAAFQFYLLEWKGELRGFLLTENMVITFLFAYLAIIFLFAQGARYDAAVSMSIPFLVAFIIFVLSIQPEVTTLHMVREWLIFPQSHYLLFFGVTALSFSIFLYREMKKNLSPDLTLFPHRVGQLTEHECGGGENR